MSVICIRMFGSCRASTRAIAGRHRYSMDMKQWVPTHVLNADRGSQLYAVAVLNRKILLRPSTFITLWNGAAMRVLVDGGANRWLKFVSNFGKGVTIRPPDFLTGDMDSISDETFASIMAVGCRTIGTPDQNETDFTKSLLEMRALYAERNIKFVINIMEFSGRIDHILAQINTLFKASARMQHIDVYLMSRNSLAWLLRPGTHAITVPQIAVDEQRWCAYVPMRGKTLVTTSGLKWDLTNHPVEFGGVVSTSNTYSSKNVRIECDNFLLWSMATDSDTTDEYD